MTSDEVSLKLESLGVPKGAPVAVAVSGGADSLALLLLLQDVFDVTALTVDHGLRPEAAAEAQKVAEQCNAFGVPHVTLSWGGEKPSGNIQAEAREARYQLMSDWCREHKVTYIAAAHHQDDQAETVLLRLARGSGVYGLAGMAPTRDLSGVTLVRPLLDVPKAALTAYLESRGIDWIEDPSNQSFKYDRVKIRKMLADPPVEGLQAGRLAATAGRLRRSRDALEHYEALWLGRAVEVRPEGYVLLDQNHLDSEPDEIVLRGLASLCRYVGNGTYVPRMEKLLRLRDHLSTKEFRGQTLYGAQFAPLSDGKVLVFREIGSCEGETSLEETCTWDNRFEISAKDDIAGLKICALGEEGWQQLKASEFDVSMLVMPRLVALGLPAVFRGPDLLAVPHLGYNKAKGVHVAVGLKRAILTKK